MDVATHNTLKEYYGDSMSCDVCKHNAGIEASSGFIQGPCGQQHCWHVLAIYDAEDQGFVYDKPLDRWVFSVE